ncbi:hypothetical protein MBLNU13_g00851t1 [Cladosporium sp. NU13]
MTPRGPLINESQQTPNADIYEDFPEGGWRAWSVVLGAWCAMIPSMGMLNTIGVLEAWIGENQLAALPKSQTAWVVSLYAFFLYIGGSCAEYYQFLLSFGVLGGLSACFLFTPSVSTIGHWFSKRQGLATGIACTAGGTGGIMFSLITLYLAPVIGFPWTMRIIGFLSLACCTVACLTLQTRPMSPSTETKSTNARPNLLTTLRHAIDLRPLAHDPSYLTTTLAITVIEFAVFLPITYLPSAALASNLPPQTSYRLIAFLNAGSVPGRALPNYLSDHFGRFNVMIITALACTLLIFCLWLPPTALDVRSEAALTVFAVLFGFWSGAAISLTPVCVAQFWGVGWGADWRGDRGWESWRGVFVVGGLCWGLLCTGVGGVWGGEICRWAEEVVGGVLM